MRNLSEPTIAVVIAARDASRFIAATLDSLVAQTQRPEQVVVYDDGSIDNTVSLVREYSTSIPNLNLIEGGKSVGISSARNRANAIVKTDFIAVLDADDIFVPETIQSYSDFLIENPQTDLLYADTKIFDSEMTSGKSRCYPSFRNSRQAIRRILGSPLLPFKHSSMVYRRESFNQLGGYDESLPIKVDVDLFLRFHAEQMKVLKLNSTTSFHRKHEHQVSTDRLRGIKIYRHLIQRYEPDPFVRSLLLSTRIPSEFLKLILRG